MTVYGQRPVLRVVMIVPAGDRASSPHPSPPGRSLPGSYLDLYLAEARVPTLDPVRAIIPDMTAGVGQLSEQGVQPHQAVVTGQRALKVL